MRIAIDATYLNKSNKAGPERYLRELLRALLITDFNNEYIIYTTQESTLVEQQKNLIVKPIATSLLVTQVGLAVSIIKDRPDLVFYPFHKFSVLAYLAGVKHCAMIHGLEYKTNNIPLLKRWLIETQLRLLTKTSRRLIVASDYVKDQVVASYNIAPEKITVIPEGVSNDFFDQVEPSTAENILKSLTINSEFVLAVSTIQPRKNYKNLILGFAEAIKQNAIKENLVICGKFGWDFEEVLKLPDQLGIKDRVIFTNYVSDEQLICLYQQARLFINVSIEEGFGLPVAEAIAKKLPLILSNIPPFKFLAEGKATFVDPYNVQEIAAALTDSLVNKPERKLAQQAEKTPSLTWENTAKKTLSTFEEVVKNS